MEASFFVNADALKRIKPDMRFDEVGLLSAFDLNRNLIYALPQRSMAAVAKGLTSWSPPIFDLSFSATTPRDVRFQVKQTLQGNSHVRVCAV